MKDIILFEGYVVLCSVVICVLFSYVVFFVSVNVVDLDLICSN